MSNSSTPRLKIRAQNVALGFAPSQDAALGFKCESCNLKIEKKDDLYLYTKPGLASPIKLPGGNLAREAYKTGVCPLCSLEMSKL